MPSHFEGSKIYFTAEWSAKFACAACCVSMTTEIQLDTTSAACLYGFVFDNKSLWRRWGVAVYGHLNGYARR